MPSALTADSDCAWIVAGFQICGDYKAVSYGFIIEQFDIGAADKFIKCGDLREGFARVRCDDCGAAAADRFSLCIATNLTSRWSYFLLVGIYPPCFKNVEQESRL